MTSEVLTTAIDAASIQRLRTTLKRMCERSFIARDLVGAELLAADASDDEEVGAAAGGKTLGAAAALAGEGGDESERTSTPTPSPAKAQPKKRKAHFLRYAACGQCGGEYDVTDNRYGDCVWHDGILDAERFFYEATGGNESDWDHFMSECDEGEADSADYCKWVCCRKGSEEEGCKVGMHSQAFRPVWVDNTPKKKRARR